MTSSFPHPRAAKHARAKAPNSAASDLFGVGDPFAVEVIENASLERASGASHGSSRVCPMFVDENDDDDFIASAAFYDEEDFVDLAPVASPVAVGGASSSGSHEHLGGDPDPDDHDIELSIAEAELLAHEDDGAAGSVGHHFAIEYYVRASVSGRFGMVTCELPPWRDYPVVCQFSSWPITLPPEQQSVSIKCFIHKNCRHAIGRKWVEDTDLLKWLYVARIPGSEAEAEQCAQEHALAWEDFRVEVKKRTKASA